MKQITEQRTNKAKLICSLWHGGQWSALYQFASSETFHGPNVLRYFQELETCLHPEYALHPGILTGKDLKQLTWLKGYLLQLSLENNYTIEFREHSVYGYQIPFLATYPEGLKIDNVTQLVYPI